MAGMFANAQKVAAPAKKGRKVEAETVTLAGMERFAALDAAINWAARCPGASTGTVEVRPIWKTR